MHLGKGEAAALYALQVRPQLAAVLCARKINAVGKDNGVGARSLDGAFAVGGGGSDQMARSEGCIIVYRTNMSNIRHLVMRCQSTGP